MSGLEEQLVESSHRNPEVMVHLSTSVDSYIKNLSMDDSDFKGISDYDHKGTFTEIISKYKHLKQKKDTSTNEYIQKMAEWIANISDIYQVKQNKYIKDKGYTNENHIKFFEEMFMILSKLLFNLQFIAATFTEFSKEIQSISNVAYDKLTLNSMKQLNVWQNLYGTQLDDVINKIAGELVFTADSKVFATKSLYVMSNNASEFLSACYKGNYLLFVADYIDYAKEYILEEDQMFNPCHVINDIITEFIEVLNYKKNFMKILFKSIEKHKKHAIQLSNEIGWVEKDIPGIEVFPKVLSIMIVCLLKLQNKNSLTMDDNDKRKLTQQCDVVLNKCKELNVGPQTKAIIKRYFGYLLNPDDGDQICQMPCSGADCVIL